MGWFDEQIRQRKLKDREIFSDSLESIASAVIGKEAAYNISSERIVTKEAVDEILNFYHYKADELPENIKDRDEQLEYLFRPYGIMRRNITLKNEWYKESFGALLAFTHDNKPAALIPSGLSGYSYFDREKGARITINKNNAEKFQETAICFYRPLPLKKIGIKDIFTYIKDSFEKRDVFFAVISAFSVTLLGMLLTQLTRTMTGNVLQNGNFNMIFGLLFFMICTGGAKTLISSVNALLINRIGTKISIYLEAAFMMRILSLPSEFFRKYNSGDIAKRSQMLRPICIILLNVVFSVGLGALMSMFYLIQFAQFASKLVMPAFIIISAVIIVNFMTIKMQMKHSKQIMELSTKESGMSLALISGIQKIKLAGAEKRAFSRWAELYSKQAELTYNPPMYLKLNGGAVNLANNRNQLMNPNNSPSTFLTAFIMLFGNILIYYMAAKYNIKPSDYFAFNAGFGFVTASLNALTSSSLIAAQVNPMLSLIEPVLQAQPETSENKKVISRISGGVELNNVYFRYNENMPFVIENMSLKIRSGEYVAIVGSTGCGKSTLIRLLLGFEKPQRGAVYYDGRDIQTVDLKSLRRMIGVVTQNGGLFQGDIYSNIVISAPQLTIDDAWKAAELAGIADDIKEMPMGMHTLISEGQGGISGGQKQRILIARAIAPRPRILMFDEATSALDNITQKIVSDSLDSLKCTRIVIAHRLSTIKHCDRILVLDKGHIVEEGNYEELISRNGIFSGLVKRQKIDE